MTTLIHAATLSVSPGDCGEQQQLHHDASLLPELILDPRQKHQPPLPVPTTIPVVHVRQRFTWDCGLACAAMALNAVYPDRPAVISLSELVEQCGTTSVWTIDLAHVLCLHGVDVMLTTTYPGPNPAYTDESFYARHMKEDVERVTKLFAQASASGILVQKTSIPGAQLRHAAASGKCLIIVLVDKSKLAMRDANLQPSSTCAMPPYTGHYILIHGYDPLSDAFMVRDPAWDVPRICSTGRVAAERLDNARVAHGTDEDLLFIGLPCSGGCSRNATSPFSGFSFLKERWHGEVNT